MGYGDVLQTAWSSYFDGQTPATRAVAISGVKQGSVLVFVGTCNSFASGETETCTQTSGPATPPIYYSVPNYDDDVPPNPSQPYLRTWYALNATAGDYTFTFQWLNAGDTHGNWMQFGIIEVEADADTFFDEDAVALNRYTEEPYIAGEEMTAFDDGFSIMFGSANHLFVPMRYTWNGTAGGVQPYTYPPASTHMHDNIGPVNTYTNPITWTAQTMGVMKGHSTLGSPDSDGIITWVGYQRIHGHKYLHDYISMTFGFGASIETTGVILPFGRGTALPDPTPSATLANTLVRVTTQTSGTATTFTRSHTANLTSTVLVAMVEFDSNPGTITHDMTADGWTRFGDVSNARVRCYYRAQGSARTSETMTWTNSVAYRMCYAELTGLTGATPTYFDDDAASHGSAAGGSAPDQNHHPEATHLAAELWLVFMNGNLNNIATEFSPAVGSWKQLASISDLHILGLNVDAGSNRPRAMAWSPGPNNGPNLITGMRLVTWLYGTPDESDEAGDRGFDEYWDVLSGTTSDISDPTAQPLALGELSDVDDNIDTDATAANREAGVAWDGASWYALETIDPGAP